MAKLSRLTRHRHGIIERLRRALETSSSRDPGNQDRRTHPQADKVSVHPWQKTEVHRSRLNNEGACFHLDKTPAVAVLPRPSDENAVKKLIGLCALYRRFVRDFAKISSPLSHITEGAVDSNGGRTATCIRRGEAKNPVAPNARPLR